MSRKVINLMQTFLSLMYWEIVYACCDARTSQYKIVIEHVW